MQHPDLKKLCTAPSLLDKEALTERIDALTDSFSFLHHGILGQSLLGQSIPLLTIGNGRHKCLYVATHHAMEWITSILLIRFVYDLCQSVRDHAKIGNLSPERLLETHTLYIVPMLNPDGVAYQMHGVEQNNPIRDRVLQMNGGSEDFSHWQANGRGVDLNHNYDAGFWEYKRMERENGTDCASPTKYSGEAPESEPETAALCNFIRMTRPLDGILSLHTQGEEIFYEGGLTPTARTKRIARCLSRVAGYKLSRTTGSASYGGLTDWCVQKEGIASFTLECGRGINPLPHTDASAIYCRLREALFLFPTML